MHRNDATVNICQAKDKMRPFYTFCSLCEEKKTVYKLMCLFCSHVPFSTTKENQKKIGQIKDNANFSLLYFMFNSHVKKRSNELVTFKEARK